MSTANWYCLHSYPSMFMLRRSKQKASKTMFSSNKRLNSYHGFICIQRLEKKFKYIWNSEVLKMHLRLQLNKDMRWAFEITIVLMHHLKYLENCLDLFLISPEILSSCFVQPKCSRSIYVWCLVNVRKATKWAILLQLPFPRTFRIKRFIPVGKSQNVFILAANCMYGLLLWVKSQWIGTSPPGIDLLVKLVSISQRNVSEDQANWIISLVVSSLESLIKLRDIGKCV